MTIVTVTIKNQKAIKTLQQLKANDLIDFKPAKGPSRKNINKDNVQTHLASEKVLAKDWLSEKENKAWQNL